MSTSIALIALITVFASTLLVACPAEPTGSGSVGEIAPRITAKSLSGDYVELSDFQGEVVLVNLWATWCGPCRVELPALEQLHRHNHDRGFSVLGVSVDGERGEKEVRKMVASLRLSYPILLDPAGRSSTAYQATGYPTSVLVGRDGRVRWRRAGAITAKDEELLRAIEAALTEPAQPSQPAPP